MKKRQTLERLKYLSRLLFILYMLLVVYCMFFSETLGRTYLREGYSYNLTPLREIRRFYRMLGGDKWFQALINLVGNVVCFIPFGACLPFIVNKCKNLIATVFFTFVFSFFIELTQFFSKVGSFDVDDLLLNTAGGLLGYIMYVILRRIYIRWELRHEK